MFTRLPGLAWCNLGIGVCFLHRHLCEAMPTFSCGPPPQAPRVPYFLSIPLTLNPGPRGLHSLLSTYYRVHCAACVRLLQTTSKLTSGMYGEYRGHFYPKWDKDWDNSKVSFSPCPGKSPKSIAIPDVETGQSGCLALGSQRIKR